MTSVKGLQRQGDQIARRVCTCWNRTGATLKRGHVAMLDMLDLEAETTSTAASNVGDSVGPFGTVTACTVVQMNQGIPVYVALEDIADNAKGDFLIEGYIEVATSDDTTSTTDLRKGKGCSVVAASLISVDGLAAGARILGIAREDAAASTADTDRKVDAVSHLRWVWWFGGNPMSNL